jgi:hypothetical protein
VKKISNTSVNCAASVRSAVVHASDWIPFVGQGVVKLSRGVARLVRVGAASDGVYPVFQRHHAHEVSVQKVTR